MSKLGGICVTALLCWNSLLMVLGNSDKVLEYPNYQPTTYILASPVQQQQVPNNGTFTNETIYNNYYQQQQQQQSGSARDSIQQASYQQQQQQLGSGRESVQQVSYGQQGTGGSAYDPYYNYYSVNQEQNNKKKPSYYYYQQPATAWSSAAASKYYYGNNNNPSYSSYTPVRNANKWRLQKRQMSHQYPWDQSYFPKQHRSSSASSVYDKWNSYNQQLQNLKSKKKLKKGNKNKRNKLLKKGINKKKKWSHRQDINDLFGSDGDEEDEEEEENDEDDFSLPSIFDEDYPDFLLSGLDDLENAADESEDFFTLGGDDDPFTTDESFPRPSILHHGLNAAASGLKSELAEAFPGLGFDKGLKRFFSVGFPFMTLSRFALKKFGFGVKMFIALMLIPFVLLFLPVPILNSNTTLPGIMPGTTNSRNKDLLLVGGEEGIIMDNNNNNVSSSSYPPVLEFGRRVLQAESCIERISCEINNFNQVTGMEADYYLFSQLMTFINNFDGLFPSFLGRMARGYNTRNTNTTCTNFICNGLKTHLS